VVVPPVVPEELLLPLPVLEPLPVCTLVVVPEEAVPDVDVWPPDPPVVLASPLVPLDEEASLELAVPVDRGLV